jgi:hypothetical protein
MVREDSHSEDCMGKHVVIDDVAASGRFLSDLGRAVVGPAVEAVRTAALVAARCRGWHITEHDEFAGWVNNQAPDVDTSIVLDPLLELGERKSRSVRVSRVLQGEHWQIVADFEGLQTIGARVVSLVDDASASGATLAYTVRAVQRLGLHVSTIAVCSASAAARNMVAGVSPQVDWHQFVEEAASTIHLRDACPYLPFSGRPHSGLPVLETSNGPIAVRVPSLVRKTGMWPQLFADFRVLAASLYARSEVVGRLSMTLGRPATVADLPALGRDVPLPAFPRHQLSAATELASIC